MKFSANGNFTNHKENLTEKTKRSFFAARRYLDFLKLPIHIINKLFNTLFFPNLTYCSEVWGIFFFFFLFEHALLHLYQKPTTTSTQNALPTIHKIITNTKNV